MNPVSVIKNLLDADSRTAVVVLAGMALLAAVAIVSGWFDAGVTTAVYIALEVLGLGVLAVILSSMVGNEYLRIIMGYAIVFFVFIILSIFTYSAVAQDPSPFKPDPCLVRFWENCELLKDKLASPPVRDVEVNSSNVKSPENATVEYTYDIFNVYIQFSGYKRETIKELANFLTERGWDVQGKELGGERIGSAQSLAQVRYKSDAQAEAAEALATDIRDSGVNSEVVAVRNPDIGTNNLEIWIGLK